MMEQVVPRPCSYLRSLRALSADGGQGVASRRQAAVLGLLRSCRDGEETKYLVRMLISVR
jgi:DNA ligase-1